MRFFVPHARDDETAEHVWAATKRFVEEQGGRRVTDRRIHRIEFQHKGDFYVAEVGEPERRSTTDRRTGQVRSGPSSVVEPVFVILETDDLYCVCTPNRGVLGGQPMLVGKHATDGVVDFDPPVS